MTVVETPPRPQPSQDELEALIEEARGRARRRRLAFVVGALAVLGAAVATLGVLRATTSGGQSASLPPGFHAVRARGPVRHALIDQLVPDTYSTIELASGRAHKTKVTQEVWWNEGTGLARTVLRLDGVVVSDVVQHLCQGSGPTRFCFPPSPFDLRQKRMTWPPRDARPAGRGMFRGDRVLWYEELVRPEPGKATLSGDQVAYDMATKHVVALRTIMRNAPRRMRGRVFDAHAVTLLPDTPTDRVTFEVPKDGAPRNVGVRYVDFRKVSLTAAGEVLGRAPLWLGPSYRVHRLRFVQAARMGSDAGNGGVANLVPFVRLDYGAFHIDEFGDARSILLEQAPPPGVIVAQPRYGLTFGRDGVLVDLQGSSGLTVDRAAAVALAKTLRPTR